MTLKIDEFRGRPFDMDRQNCYTLLRDFYRENYDIHLADYACPTDWWNSGLDIYRDLAHQEGFRVINLAPHQWEPGDIILMALQASVGNHIGILIPGNRLLHHMRGQLSCVTSYGGSFRNNTVAVYRHPDVQKQQPVTTLDLKGILPPHVRRKLEVS